VSNIEIVPDQMGRFEIYGKEYEVSPATDVIMRFVDPEYDFLQYLDPEVQAITFHWLGKSALSALAGFGIPETRQRLKMPQCLYDEYIGWQERFGLAQFEQDLETLPDSEPDELDHYFEASDEES